MHRGCLCSCCSPIPSTMEQNRTLCNSRAIFTKVPLKTSPGPHESARLGLQAPEPPMGSQESQRSQYRSSAVPALARAARSCGFGSARGGGGGAGLRGGWGSPGRAGADCSRCPPCPPVPPPVPVPPRSPALRRAQPEGAPRWRTAAALEALPGQVGGGGTGGNRGEMGGTGTASGSALRVRPSLPEAAEPPPRGGSRSARTPQHLPAEVPRCLPPRGHHPLEGGSLQPPPWGGFPVDPFCPRCIFPGGPLRPSSPPPAVPIFRDCTKP